MTGRSIVNPKCGFGLLNELVNYCPVLNPTRQKEEGILDVEREALPRGDQFLERGTGYSTEQATKPSTIGLVLGSNPIALLAWYLQNILLCLFDG